MKQIVTDYFRFESSMIDSWPILQLIEEHGMEGFGIYVSLMARLRQMKDFQNKVEVIRSYARSWNVAEEKIKDIIHCSELFDIDELENVFSSPYLDRVMETLTQRRNQRSNGGRKRAESATRDSNGRFTSSHQLTDIQTELQTDLQNKKEAVENITDENTCAVLSDFHEEVPTPMQHWESYVDEAMNQPSWVEILAMHCRLPLDRWAEVVKAFKEHVVLQGNECTIRSLKDAKNYFANFIRPGTPTHKRLSEELSRLDSKNRETDPYRYEQVDRQTGERSYYGVLIPAHSPPRPHENAVWNNELQLWTK